MSSLNEQEKQLLETLLSQADAVSPSSERSRHAEHTDFHNSENDFHFLDKYINSSMGDEIESMAFSEHAANASFDNQGHGSNFQTAGQGQDCQQPGCGGPMFAQQPSPAYTSQQASMQGYQQYSPSTEHVQMSSSVGDSFQGQGASYQQEFPMATQKSPLDQSSPAGSPYGNPSSSFTSQFKLDLGRGAQNGLAGSSSAFTSSSSGLSFHSPSSGFPQSESNVEAGPPETYHHSAGSCHHTAAPSSGCGGADMGSLAPGECPAQVADYQQMQAFPTSFSPVAPSVVSVPAASAGNSQQSTSVGDTDSSAPVTNFSSQVSGFQAQQHQQNLLFQQDSPQPVLYLDKALQESRHEASRVHFQSDASGFVQERHQKQQQAEMFSHGGSTGPALSTPHGQQGGGFSQQQQSGQFQNCLHSSGQAEQEVGNAGGPHVQLSNFQMQASFQKPTNSPVQPPCLEQSASDSPASFLSFPSSSQHSVCLLAPSAQAEPAAAGVCQNQVYQQQIDQNLEGTFHAQAPTPGFSHGVHQGDQIVSSTDSQSQSQGYTGEAVPADRQTAGFVHHAFQLSSQASRQDHEPMQETSREKNMEAESTGFVADLSNPVNAVPFQDQTMEDSAGGGQFAGKAKLFEQQSSRLFEQQSSRLFEQQSSSPSGQQEQPMDTQQSPFYSGTTASPSQIFDTKTSTLSVPQTHETVDRFVSQSAGFQGKVNGLPATQDASSSDSGVQFQGFIPSSLPINNSLFSAKAEIHSKAVCTSFTDSGLFGLQSMGVPGQSNGPVSFSDMPTGPNSSLNSSAASSLQSDVLKQTSASFNQFESGSGSTFVSSPTQQQHQHHQLEQQPIQMTQQHVQQQHQGHVQRGVYPHNDQGRDSFPFSPNKSSEVLSALMSQEAGAQFAHDGSSTPSILPMQAAPVPGVNSCPQDSSQFQATVLASRHHQGAGPGGTAHQPSPSFSFTSPGSSPVPTPASVTLMADKSPLAALFDSHHANAALNLLASVVLSQLQAILPHSAQVFGASQHQKQSPALPLGGVIASGSPTTPGATADTMQQFLQAQANKNKIDSPLLVPQQQQAFQAPPVLQTTPSHVHPQSQAQAAAFPQSSPVPQAQPTFPTAQVLQQPGLMAPQQLAQDVHQQDPVSTSWQLQQQVVQLPTSLASSLGLTVGSSGHLMMGDQVVRLVIQPSTLDSGSASSEVSSTSLTGHTGVQQPVLPTLMVSLPADLKNIDVQPLGSGLVSSSHFTTTTTTPSLDSSMPGHSTVSSFIMKQPVSGITAANTPPPASSADSCDVRGAPQDAAVTPFMPPANVQAPALSSLPTANTEGASSAGNIFFQVSSPSAGAEKLMEVSQSSGGGRDSVGAFTSVASTSSNMSVVNAFTMAVGDQHAEVAEFKVPDCPATQTSGNPCSRPGNPCSGDGAKPMEINQASVTSAVLAMDVGDVAGEPFSERLLDKTKIREHGMSKRLVRKSSVEDKVEERLDTGSMLRRILTMEDDDPVEGLPNSDMLPEVSSPGDSPDKQDTESPNALVADTNTQTTLIEKSEKLDLSCDAPADSDAPSEFWSSVGDFPVDEVVPPKVHKGLSDQDASCKIVSIPSVEKLFDAGGASSCSSFVFTKFGSEDCVFTFGTSQSSLVSTSATDTKVTSVISSSGVKQPDCVRLCVLPGPPIRANSRRQREASLTAQFPSKVGLYELRILTQPEEQHRARYLTEGSRGAVKDRSQQGYPVIKLYGHKEPATLQVFIGSESGRIKPHGFYQACRVCGKNSTQCTEREIEGTTVIEIEMSPMNDMLISMDCVGILKLRNADVEKRIGIARAKAKKKNSTKARLVFRVMLRKPDGSYLTLQTASTPILCTQPVGQPEISRMSLSEVSVSQTRDLFIIGKNFLKGTRVMFQKLALDEKTVEWQSEAEIEAEYFQQTHLICKVPEYPEKAITKPVCVQIVVQSGGKCSDAQDFMYTPAKVLVKQEDPMDTESSSRTLSFAVSPVALQLNRLVEQTQQEATSTSLFQLPPNMLPSMASSSVTSSISRVPVGASSLTLSSPLLKPATFTMPSSNQGVLNFVTRTTPLVTSAPTGGSLNIRTKATGLPTHILIPSLQAGQTGPAETGQSGLKFPKLLMVNPGTSVSAVPVKTCDSSIVSAGISISTGNRTASSANVGAMTASTPASSSLVTNRLGNVGINTQSASSCAPMIVILTTPASSSGVTPQ